MNFDVMEAVQQLMIWKDFYYQGRPIVPDATFDALERQLREVDPENDYFNRVGAAVRGVKVRHNIPMGSLNQVTSDDEINALYDSFKRMGSEAVVYTHKLDGSSIELTFDEFGKLERAATRGDGNEGLDITRHFNRLRDRIPTTQPHDVVRCEAIVRVEDFDRINADGKYKNPRNYVAGQLNRSVADQDFIDIIRFVAFELVRKPLTGEYTVNKSTRLRDLSHMGFEVACMAALTSGTRFNQEELAELLAEAKELSPYELDGIVIDVDNFETQEKLTYDITHPATGVVTRQANPKFAAKFKINVNFIETPVNDVIYAASKDGYLKPRVEIEPVELAGVTITFATGFNAKFIKDNKIGPGAIVRVTRSGDVIPFIESVIKGSDDGWKEPEGFGEYDWNETGVDLVLKDLPDESFILQIVDFFTAINAPLLKLGNVTKLYESGYNTIAKIIQADESVFTTILGENGQKAFVGLKGILNPIDEWKLAGSLPFFGRGIGRTKMKAVAEAIGSIAALNAKEAPEQVIIASVPGFDIKSAEKLANGLPEYISFLNETKGLISVSEYIKVSGDLNGVVVVFTGVRDKALEAEIEKRGGKITNSIGKTTTHLVAKDTTGSSTKLKKVEELNTKYGLNIKVMNLESAKRPDAFN